MTSTVASYAASATYSSAFVDASAASDSLVRSRSVSSRPPVLSGPRTPPPVPLLDTRAALKEGMRRPYIQKPCGPPPARPPMTPSTGGEKPAVYFRQYTYDVFPSGDNPSSRSRSLYSETTRPYSGATGHSSSTANTSDDDECLTPSTAKRPLLPQPGASRGGIGRKLSLTFLTGDRSRPSTPASPQRLAPKRVTKQLTTNSEPNLALHRSPSSETLPPVLDSPPNSIQPIVTIERIPTPTLPIVAAQSAISQYFTDAPSSSSPPHSSSSTEGIAPLSPLNQIQYTSASFEMRAKKNRFKLSKDQAVEIISAAWKAWRLRNETKLRDLVDIITRTRHQAAVCIQRMWKGYRVRQFVYSEVCKQRILYWEPSMKKLSDAELESWSVKIFGAFTMPAWSSEVSMEYCRIRRMFVLYTNVPPGQYEGKFNVNGDIKICPWIHGTAVKSDGHENSCIVIALHPMREWWSKRLESDNRNALCSAKHQRITGFALSSSRQPSL